MSKVKSFKYKIEYEDDSKFEEGMICAVDVNAKLELLKHTLKFIEKLFKRDTAPTIREL